MTAVARAIERVRKASVGRQPAMDERVSQTQTRDVLRVRHIDRRQSNDRNERKQEDFTPRTRPRQPTLRHHHAFTLDVAAAAEGS